VSPKEEPKTYPEYEAIKIRWPLMSDEEKAAYNQKTIKGFPPGHPEAEKIRSTGR